MKKSFLWIMPLIVLLFILTLIIYNNDNLNKINKRIKEDNYNLSKENKRLRKIELKVIKGDCK